MGTWHFLSTLSNSSDPSFPESTSLTPLDISSGVQPRGTRVTESVDQVGSKETRRSNWLTKEVFPSLTAAAAKPHAQQPST